MLNDDFDGVGGISGETAVNIGMDGAVANNAGLHPISSLPIHKQISNLLCSSWRRSCISNTITRQLPFIPVRHYADLLGRKLPKISTNSMRSRYDLLQAL